MRSSFNSLAVSLRTSSNHPCGSFVYSLHATFWLHQTRLRLAELPDQLQMVWEETDARAWSRGTRGRNRRGTRTPWSNSPDNAYTKTHYICALSNIHCFENTGKPQAWHSQAMEYLGAILYDLVQTGEEPCPTWKASRVNCLS